MRIIAGKHRSRKLFEPRTMDIRPTTDRTKESLFNIINQNIIDSTFLDLFSGSCSVSFEADSRGAKEVISVDNSAESKKCYLKNSEKMDNNITYVNRDVIAFLESTHQRFDYIFMDPPYDIDEEILKQVIDLSLDRLTDDGELILEMASRRRLNLSNVKDVRKYGKSSLYFLLKE